MVPAPSRPRVEVVAVALTTRRGPCIEVVALVPSPKALELLVRCRSKGPRAWLEMELGAGMAMM